MILLYTICGATWGIVISIIMMEEGNPLHDIIIAYPKHIRPTMKVIAIIFGMIWEAFVWPVDIPLKLYRIYIKK